MLGYYILNLIFVNIGVRENARAEKIYKAFHKRSVSDRLADPESYICPSSETKNSCNHITVDNCLVYI